QPVLPGAGDLEDEEDRSQRGPPHGGEHRSHPDDGEGAGGQFGESPPRPDQLGEGGADHGPDEQGGHVLPSGTITWVPRRTATSVDPSGQATSLTACPSAIDPGGMRKS